MKKSNFLIGVIIAVWAIFVGIGFVQLTDYSVNPGKPANISEKIPAGIFDDSAKTLPKLVFFIHPKCPCSRATLNELARMIAVEQNKMKVKIFFYKPDDKPDEWAKTDLWKIAENIPGVESGVMNEREIEAFGVITSGQTILYNESGEAVFSGGITIGRGHEGKSAGRTAIEDYLETGKMEIGETPVFGCILTSKELEIP